MCDKLAMNQTNHKRHHSIDERKDTNRFEIYKEHPDKGHRRIRDDLEKDYDIRTSNKRVLNLCQMLHIQSTVKFRKQGCTRNASDPQVTAQNRLHREFWAGHPNEKWLTDVTEFKWYQGPIIHKLYLSAILDLCDRRIVSYVIRDRNDNKLVFDTLDKSCSGKTECTPAVPQRPWIPVHQQNLPQETAGCRDDTEYVPCWPLH